MKIFLLTEIQGEIESPDQAYKQIRNFCSALQSFRETTPSEITAFSQDPIEAYRATLIAILGVVRTIPPHVMGPRNQEVWQAVEMLHDATIHYNPTIETKLGI